MKIWFTRSAWVLAVLAAFWGGGVLREARADDATDASVLSQIFDEAGATPTRNLSADAWGTFSKTPDVPFEDIYLFTLQTAAEKPAQEALIALDRYEPNYNQNELEQILMQGNIGILTQKIASQRQDEVAAELTRLQAAYDDELGLQNSTFTLDQEAYTQDMFFNNQLKDSANVDILVDLSLIYQLFFGEALELPNRGADGDVALSSEDDLPVWDAPVNLASIDSDLACFSDPELTAALQEFQNLVNPTPVDETETPADAEVAGVDIRDSAPVVQGDDGSVTLFGAPPALLQEANDPVAVALKDPEPTPLSAFNDLIKDYGASKGDWTRALPCGKVFCIEVNLKKETLGTKTPSEVGAGGIPYSPTDSCIACHLAFIYARMEQTLAKPLAPGKVSANFFEDGTCKKSGGKINLDLNIFTYPKAIQLDPGEDTVSVPDEISTKLSADLTALGALPDERDDYVNAAADVACERQRNYQNLGGYSENLGAALAECATSSALVEEDIQNAFDSYLAQVSANHDGLLYEEVATQLNRFLGQLEAMSEFMQSTVNGQNAPLASAVSKPYCE